MNRGEDSEPPAAVSGSAVAELRRRALTDAGTTVLLVDATLRVVMASAPEGSRNPGASLIGASLVDALDAPHEGERLEAAVRRAQLGSGTQLLLSGREIGRRSVRCIPLEGSVSGTTLVLVVLSDERSVEAGSDELRQRAADLETLVAASRSLARSTYAEEARRTVCEAAADVAQAELAVLLLLRPDGLGLVASASVGAELEGQMVTLDRASLAARAFSGGKATFSSELTGPDATSAWPLGGAGAKAGVWQPIRRAVGIRGVIAVGWCRPEEPPGERLLGSLELLAGEAAVAIDRAVAIERLTGLARTDPLTELFNRRAWQEELDRELARAERGGLSLSIGLIDLDQLKTYNDRWGHAAGDRVLLTAAARWRRRLRLTDLLARIGGDEFAVTMPGCGLEEATQLGDQLRGALPDGVSCSVGVAQWSPGEPAAEVVARADEALYAAKNSGRNATFSLSAPGGTGTMGSVPSG